MRFAADPPGTHGVLTQLFRVPEDFIHRIPECLSLQEAVLVKPLSVAVHGVRMAKLAPGQAVLVQGSGTVGLLCAAVASAFGAKTVCVADINETKLDFARSFVNCMTFLSDPTVSPADDAARFKKENRMPNGVDVVLECTGVQSSAQTGLHASAAGSTFVQIGMGRPEQTLPLGTMMEKEVTLKTSFRYGPGDYDIAIELLSAGKVQVGTMISSVVPFEHATEAWEKTKRGTGIKNLIQGVQD
ncbi:D-xylulose reductase A [Pochonia chlamydosporia 170]|uniref:L-arabinitol 4-dehydrogenase n=1 Tax=Pochonia chlamydosporia 170 TaxID=1380566 RepID=A0A179FW54_METCM|nr:D-xylulose reductase A [Pochonia chlamydosporia 170]OAQ69597.1 D-xylulose reductase A [Pochonia chlamydosporia 170]